MGLDKLDHRESELRHRSLADPWAFGAELTDPLADLDLSVPDGVDAPLLAAYALGLADDALVAAQRLSEWCSRAPDLEVDLALANLALDLLGQARPLLARAAAADPRLVPELPPGSPVPPDDRLAFFRDASAFRNARVLELPRGDFAHTVVGLLLHSTVRLAVLERLRASVDPVLAAVAGKGVPELGYHRDWSARWFVTLALGTDESRRRLVEAVGELWPHLGELLAGSEVDRSAAATGIGVDPATTAGEVHDVLGQVWSAAQLELPDLPGHTGPLGRDGDHTPALTELLDEMQSVARAHPMGRW